MNIKNWFLFLFASMFFITSCHTHNLQKSSSISNRFIRVSHDNISYFSFADGSPYIPVGINMINPSGRYNENPDSAFYEIDQWMKNLSANGGNFIRVWLSNSFWDIEEEAGKYNEEKALRIDRFIAMARKYHLRIKLTLEHFRSVTLEENQQQWATKFAYHTSRGGPFDSVRQYLTSSEGERLFLNKIDFYRKRYGSDTLFFGWELWNEMNAMKVPKDSVFYAWNEKMLSAVKQKFPENPVMQSLGSFDGEYAKPVYKKIMGMPGNEVAQVHRYLDLGAEMEVCHAPMDIICASAVKELLEYHLPKPILLAETGAVEPHHAGPSKRLTDFVLKGNNDLGRFHALWTMEGLKIIDPELLFQLLQDKTPLIGATVVRLLEPIAKRDKSIRVKFEEELLKLWENAPVEQILQIALTANILDPKISHQLLGGIAERYDTSALFRDAILSSLGDQEFVFLKSLLTSPSWQEHEPSREIFIEMLTTSVVRKRSPAELTALLSMLDVKKDFNWKEKAVLAGISVMGKNGKMKPIRLRSAPTILTRHDLKNSQSQLHILMAMFEWPGHVANTDSIKPQHPLNEGEQKQFVLGRQLYLTTCAACHGTDGAGMNRFAPPLTGSDWVLGNEKRLILVLLHGMEGPVEVNGKLYDVPDILPVMPAHSTLNDAAISSILTYIRNEWDNAAGPVNARVVGATRHTSQGRVVPWTVAELNKHIVDTNAANEK